MAIADLEGCIPEVSLDYFKASVLPPLTREQLSSLGSAASSHVDPKSDLWAEFSTDPKNAEGPENTVFTILPDLLNGIVKGVANAFGREKEDAMWQAQANPNAVFNSEKTLHANFSVDGFAALQEPRGLGPYVWKDRKEEEGGIGKKPTDKPAPSTDSGVRDVSPQPFDCVRNAADVVFVYVVRQNNDFRKDVLDNQCKVLHAARHLLYNDPSRRFTFGITIENRQARLWFFSRFLVMATVTFDWIKNRIHLIHFVGSLAFASLPELGFDTSIRRISEQVPKQNSKKGVKEDRITYDIQCGETWYRVIKPLSEYKAARILGRATRVWEVRQLQDQDGHLTPVGDPLVMKDVWIDQNSRSEGEILNDIIEKVNTVHPIEGLDREKAKELVAKHFVGIKMDEIVQVGDFGLSKTDTTATILRDSDLPTEANALRLAEEKSSSHDPNRTTSTTGSLPQPERGPPGSSSDRTHLHRSMANLKISGHPCAVQRGAVSAKQHRRILYADYGQPVDAEDVMLNHKKYFNSLSKVAQGLKLLFSAGYIHRDLSTGNLIYCEDGSCKISDLEYAKPCGLVQELGIENEGGVDKGGKTGTPAFMAIEIQAGRVVITPTPSDSDSNDESNYLDLTNETPLPVLSHHYLHDLESLWWIAVWALFMSKPASDKKLTLLEEFDSVFPYEVRGSTDRVLFFTNETFFTEVARSFPGVIKGSAGSLEKLRKGLLKAYRTFRRGLDAQQDFPAKVVVRAYDRAAEGFRRAASRATPEELVLTPRYVPVVEQSEKEGEEKEISR